MGPVKSLISIMKAVVALVSVMALTLPSVESHGRLMDPPSRASQWRFGFNNPKDYNDNQGYCGGVMHQNVQMGGKCGICGDPWDGPREHEAPGGRYANGNIVATYRQDPTQKCFDAHPLQLGGGKHGEELPITEWGRRYWNTTVKLPEGLTCSQCILQWTYTAGNSWGTFPNGTSCVGCGPQEHFRACADIKIH